MVTVPKSTSQGLSPDGNPGSFPPSGNSGALCMETLSLPRLTIGLPVWLFSTLVLLSVMTPIPPSPSSEP